MNRLKVISLLIIATITVFSAVLYTSCKKDACVGVTCFNNAPCSNGKCICPPGFSNSTTSDPQCITRNVTSITFVNNTPSYIEITTPASGTIEIGPGQIDSFRGNYGSAQAITATTTSFSSFLYGEVITWNLSDTFPVNGTIIVPINVPSSYFFLSITNNNTTYTVTQAIVNYNLSSQTTISGLDIYYGSSYTTPIGYFRSSAAPNILLSDYTAYTWPVINFTLPNTANQSYTAIVN